MNAPSPYAQKQPSTTPITVQDMWNTRPVRIPKDQGGNAKWLGVCEGIGVRYQVDPTLIRVGFAVATVAGGVGLPVYLACAGVMPRYSKSTSPFEEALTDAEGGATKESSLGWWLLTGLIVTAFLGVGVTSGTGLLVVAAAMGSLYLLHKRQPAPPAGLLASPDTPSSPTPIDLSTIEPLPGYPLPPGRQAPPAWDPLGVAPDMWNLPEPAPRYEAPVKKKKTGRVIAAGTVAASALAVGGVVAVGALSAPASTNSDSVTTSGMGSLSLKPASLSELGDDVQTDVGSISLDLTNVHDFSLPEGEKSMDVETGIGSIDMRLPADAKVNVYCEPGIGSATCPAPQDIPDAPTIYVSSGVGSINVTRNG